MSIAVEELLAGSRVVPVVVLDDAQQAVPLARTLCEAGLTVIEITLRTDAALESIRRIAADVPHATVGAGSVREAGQLDLVRAAGGRFAVSPGSSDGVLEAARRPALPLIPGAATATEAMRLMERGYRVLKFFPAELCGGVAMLKALGAPLPEARFFPTGGITPELAPDYLALPNVTCIGGSWIVPPALLSDGKFETIGELAAAAATI